MIQSLNGFSRPILFVSRGEGSSRLISYIGWPVPCRNPEIEEQSRCQSINVMSGQSPEKAESTSLRRDQGPICIDSQINEGTGKDGPHNSVKYPQRNL